MKEVVKVKRSRNILLFILSTPVIWSLIVPLLILDLWTEIYHRVCFPVYGIPCVKRYHYIMVMDRFKLPYLTFMQKLGCAYCGYANGLMQYRKEIVARTERYWCPIMHAKREKFLEEEHHKRLHFAEYGDEEGFKEKFNKHDV